MKLRMLILCMGFSVSVYASDIDIKKLPLPDSATIHTVSDYSIQNGLPMAIAILRSADPYDRTVKFYKDLWGKADRPEMPGFIETEIEHWLIIGRLDNGINTVIQFDKRLPENTSAYVSQAQVANPVTVAEDSEFPELLRLSTTTSVDGSARSTLTVYASHASVDATAQRSIRYLRQRGWLLVSHSTHAKAQSLSLVRNRERLQMVVSKAQRYPSQVVVNKVSHQ
ncbi:MAG: hypothetical protein KTR32_11425 [Granulosicoccus sp.]|nr:hypothetical protein [Granulosicoccus sp.]